MTWKTCCRRALRLRMGGFFVVFGLGPNFSFVASLLGYTQHEHWCVAFSGSRAVMKKGIATYTHWNWCL